MNTKISIYYTITLLVILGFTSYIFSIVSSANKLVAVLFAYLAIVSIAMLANLDWASVGLSKDNILKGFIFALPFIAVVIIGAITVFLLNPEVFKDERYNQSSRLVLYTIFITLPLFTVLLEEIAFRGVLFGTLQTIVSQNYAVIVSSLSFGVWHVFSASAVSTTSIPESVPKILIILGIILATTLAGIFLAWARIKSESLVAPILIHWTINATGVILSYFAWQKT